MANVLIIDDDELMCDILVRKVEQMGHQGRASVRLEEGLNMALSESFDVIYLDVLLPDGNGLDYLPKFRETQGSPEVIIMTGLGDPDGADLAMVNGAWDYIEKWATLNAMVLPLVRAIQYRDEKRRNAWSANGNGARHATATEPLPTLKDRRQFALAEAEKEYLRDVLEFTGGDMDKACEIAGVARATLLALMRKHGVARP